MIGSVCAYIGSRGAENVDANLGGNTKGAGWMIVAILPSTTRGETRTFEEEQVVGSRNSSLYYTSTSTDEQLVCTKRGSEYRKVDKY
jgi:hypothetical protein